LLRLAIRLSLHLYIALVSIAQWLRRRPRPANETGYTVLVTLKFYSPGWATAMFQPLTLSSRCAHLVVVAPAPVPQMDKVVVIHPPAWLTSLVGAAIARLITFAYVAVAWRPHWIGGYHLAFNGLAAGLMASIVGARSLYVSVGGPAEIVGGGVCSENPVLSAIGVPDLQIERQLVRAAGQFDAIATMGHATIRFLRERGVNAPLCVIPGGIDSRVYSDQREHRDVDLLFLGRLSRIKRPDIFLRAVRLVNQERCGLRAAIIGQGELRQELEALRDELGLGDCSELLGFQPDVSAWFRRSKIFVLTSESEGLSLSLLEAMMSGAVPVVADVGELSDIVENGVNGYLVAGRSPAEFAAPMVSLLNDVDRLANFSSEARQSALRYEAHAVARLWDELLTIGQPTTESIRPTIGAGS
jgi:glycosyltransferase involved in cell wall biosynthesis